MTVNWFEGLLLLYATAALIGGSWYAFRCVDYIRAADQWHTAGTPWRRVGVVLSIFSVLWLLGTLTLPFMRWLPTEFDTDALIKSIKDSEEEADQ